MSITYHPNELYPRAHKKSQCMNCKEDFFYATGEHIDKCQLLDRSDSTTVCKVCNYKLATGGLTYFEMYTGSKGNSF